VESKANTGGPIIPKRPRAPKPKAPTPASRPAQNPSISNHAGAGAHGPTSTWTAPSPSVFVPRPVDRRPNVGTNSLLAEVKELRDMRGEPQDTRRRGNENMRGSMKGDLIKMMQANGDVNEPNLDTVEYLEDMVVDFLAVLVSWSVRFLTVVDAAVPPGPTHSSDAYCA
jgi:hypothetical protein